MDDKIYELLEKMYVDLKGSISGVEGRLDNLGNEVKSIGNQIAKLENDLKPKVEAALDGYKTVFEKLTVLEEKVDSISSKVEKQDVEIRVIKNAK